VKKQKPKNQRPNSSAPAFQQRLRELDEQRPPLPQGTIDIRLTPARNAADPLALRILAEGEDWPARVTLSLSRDWLGVALEHQHLGDKPVSVMSGGGIDTRKGAATNLQRLLVRYADEAARDISQQTFEQLHGEKVLAAEMALLGAEFFEERLRAEFPLLLERLAGEAVEKMRQEVERRAGHAILWQALPEPKRRQWRSGGESALEHFIRVAAETKPGRSIHKKRSELDDKDGLDTSTASRLARGKRIADVLLGRAAELEKRKGRHWKNRGKKRQ
jgi:hypothetical protein